MARKDKDREKGKEDKSRDEKTRDRGLDRPAPEGLEARLARIEAALSTLPSAPGTEGPLPQTPLPTDWSPLAPRLAALGHPARLAILRAALDGPRPTAALMAAAGMTTPGQFYHHLRELTAAGWLTTPARGTYGVPPARAGALVAVISAVG